MGRVKDLVASIWRHLLIWRYRGEQHDACRQQHDALERLEQQHAGGRPFDPRR